MPFTPKLVVLKSVLFDIVWGQGGQSLDRGDLMQLENSDGTEPNSSDGKSLAIYM